VTTCTPWPSISECTEAQHCSGCGIERLGRRSESGLSTDWPTAAEKPAGGVIKA